MNNKYGFTLIELLVTIGLIALLMLIFMPTILNMGKNVKQENYNSKVTLIEKAAINFVEENKNSVKGNSNLCIAVKELIKRGFLVSDGKTDTYITDPTSNGQYIDGYVLISYSYEDNAWKSNSEYIGNSSSCTIVSPLADVYSSKYDIETGILPEGQLLINNGATYTKSLSVTLKITDSKSVATTMCVSVNNSNCLAWETYKSTKTFTLDSTGGNGIKNVYLWLANEGGEYTGPFNDTIIYDSTNPTIAFNPNGNATAQKSQSSAVTVTDTYLDLTNIKYVWGSTNTTNASTGTLMSSNSQTITKNTGTGNYYLCIYAADLAGNTVNQCSNVFAFNNSAPTVTFNPNGNTSAGPSKSTIATISTTGAIYVRKYLVTTVSNADASTGTSMTSNSQTINITGGSGTYYVCIYALDTVGNSINTCSNAFTLSPNPPTISFSPNGNTSSGTSKSTVATINTTGTINIRKYLVTTVSNASASSGTTMTSNNQTINITGTPGTYYVCVYASDTLGNSTNTCSNAFILSSNPPTVAFSPNSNTSSGSSKSTTVTISTSSTITTRKYIWATSPGTNASYGLNMSSNSQTLSVSSPGTWYLCIYAVDSNGSVNTCSGQFYVSNIVITTPSIYSSQFNNTGLWQTSHIVFSCYASDGIASMNVTSGAGFLNYYSHIKTGTTEKVMVGMNASYSTSFTISISCTTNSGGSSSSTYMYNTLGPFNGSYISQFTYPSCYASSSNYLCTYNYFGASYYCTTSAGVACGNSQNNGTYFSAIPGGIYNINPENTEVCISAYGYYVNCCM